MAKNYTNIRNNNLFIDSAVFNDQTFQLYCDLFEDIARARFQWENLPSSMNEIWLERSLYYDGMAAALKDKRFRFYQHKGFKCWLYKYLWFANKIALLFL